jgi:hypothetical protein
MKDKLVHLGIISIFVSLYFLVATISMINSVAFFDLSHSGLMSWSLAIGFELGAAASLAAIIILDKTNKTMVWSLFLLLTAFQMMANSYHAFVNLEDYMGWIELFGLEEEEPIFQKRILSVVSGAVLPLVALGFIKSLTDYIRPEETVTEEEVFAELDADIKEPSDNVAEVINEPVKPLGKVAEESLNIENFEDDVLPPTAVEDFEKKTDISRLSKTNVHHVEKVLKQNLDSPVTPPSETQRKHYQPKP